ncbi:MAG TPA: hypothetical protein PKE26_14660 [Kiritimatiellia bacterium]|nr:hypothetical protein [Kiritimatiellia bacterium]HMP00342.1 hypothetical protein [Kiritimatiellia bacterium]HMP97209.1 hypothetical protein [Kiritimatiellia bacterium]
MKKTLFACLIGLYAFTETHAQYYAPQPGYRQAPPPGRSMGHPDAFRMQPNDPRAYRAAEPVIYPYDERGRPNPDAFEWTGFSLGVKAGTVGLGLDATIYLAEWVNFRTGLQAFYFTYKDTIYGVDFDYDLTMLGIPLLLDFYPTDSGNFRLSAGVILSSTEVDISGSTRTIARINGVEFSKQQVGTISGTADYDTVVPYFGIGFGNPVKPDSALTFTFDFGFMIQDYDLSLKSNGTAANDAGFKKALGDFAGEVEDVLDYLKIYPVITFGLAYHF